MPGWRYDRNRTKRAGVIGVYRDFGRPRSMLVVAVKPCEIVSWKSDEVVVPLLVTIRETDTECVNDPDVPFTVTL